MNTIEVLGLTKRFGRFTAVDDVTFNVARGEILGFLGANGAGKTTIIRMLCGLLSPSSGRATVGGFDVARQSEQVKRNIGYMSQKFSLYPDLTVMENLTFFGGVYGIPIPKLRERAAWALDMAGLHGREKSLTSELSGGWRQRLALGCAILHEPKIIFLDEPTSGVDPVSRRRFWELIDRLAEAGTTVFVTTHYLDEAEYCNHVMLIHAGRLIAGGSPQELKARTFKTPILEVRCDRLIDALAVLQEQPWALETAVFGDALHVRVEDEAGGTERIRTTLAGRGIAVERVGRIVPSLQDVFIDLVEHQTQKG
ncbi:MAG TPA: ABC transporter ATP-binding protein [bacterium]|nr:ABC transporter ATP-binding protein [bacterium]